MVTTKGPFEGIPASEYDHYLGKTLKIDKDQDEILLPEDFDQ